MDIAHAMWIHGHSMQIQHPDRVSSVERGGFYIRVKGKPAKSNWFHFAIPTPVIVDKNRLRVGSVILRFKTGTEVSVNAVHVYDAENRIDSHDNLNLSHQNMSFERFKVHGNPEISSGGIGISIGVIFGVQGGGERDWLRIEFSSAGCDFLPPIKR